MNNRSHGKTIFGWLLAAAALILVLCANEIFGLPPLMTKQGSIPAEIAGAWEADLTAVSGRRLPDAIAVKLRIGQDGSVIGTIGAAEAAGKLTANRTWFGRMMHWRTEYIIQGTLSRVVESFGGTAGDRFSAPVDLSGGELAGSLFLSHPGEPKPLGLRLRKR